MTQPFFKFRDEDLPPGPWAQLAEGLDYETLDSGIRETVRWLRTNGIDTTDSGDGVSKKQEDGCTIPWPHVFVRCWAHQTHKVAADLAHGIRQVGFWIVPMRDKPESVGPFEVCVEGSFEVANDIGIVGIHYLDDAKLAAARSKKAP